MDDKKGKFELVGLALPNLYWLDAVPGEGGAFWGYHHAIAHVEPSSPTWNRLSVAKASRCGGRLEIGAIGKKRILGREREEPIEVRCSSCGFQFRLGDHWEEATWEWMRMAFAAGLEELFDHPASPLKDIALSHPTGNRLLPLLPLRRQIDNSVVEFISAAKRSKIGSVISTYIPVWSNYGIAIARVEGLESAEGLAYLVAISALLLGEMEKSFQGAIKRAAQLASSASRSFHPRSR